MSESRLSGVGAHPPGGGTGGRRWALPAATAAAGVWILAIHLWAQTDAPVGVFYDDGLYALLAESLAEGRGYRYSNLPGAPPGVHFPPAYPLLLAVVWRLGPEFPASVPWLKALNAVLLASGGALLCLYLVRRLGLPLLWAALVPALTLVTVPFLAVSTVLFSEPLFFLLAVAALWVADRPESSRLAAGAAGALAGATFLVRSLGLALVLGVVWASARRGRNAALAAAAPATLLVVPWLVWVGVRAPEVPLLLRANYGSYTGEVAAALSASPVATVLKLVTANLAEWLRFGSVILTPGAPLVVQTAIVVAAFAGAARAAWVVRHRVPALGVSLAAYAGATLLWPFPPDRYLTLILPWLAALLVMAVGRSWDRLGGWVKDAGGARRVRAGVLVLLALLVANAVRFQAAGYRARGWEHPQRRAEEALWPIVEWVRAGTAPGDVIATDGEPLIHLYTGRSAVPNTVRHPRAPYVGVAGETGTAAELLQLLSHTRADYLAVSVGAGPTARVVEQLAFARPELLLLVHITPVGGRIFRVQAPPALAVR